MPAKCALFVRDRKPSVLIGLRGGGHSRSRTRLSIQSIFPSKQVDKMRSYASDSEAKTPPTIFPPIKGP